MKKAKMAITTVMIVSAMTFGSATVASEQDPAETRFTVNTAVPGEQEIIADLVGHRMYVSETLPGIWEFRSIANVQRSSIGSTRLNGESLEYNFTMILVDERAPNKDAYKAEVLIAYQLVENSWRLQNVREVSFQPAGNINLILSDEC